MKRGSDLKNSGDETRYKVLIELIQPHAKEEIRSSKAGAYKSLYLIQHKALEFTACGLVV